MFYFFHRIYILLGYLFLPLLWLFLQTRLIRKKEILARISERYGKPTLKRPKGPLLWLHGASVGESLSALPLLERLQKLYPDLNILVTSGTVSSSKILKKRLPPGIMHQFLPMDILIYVKRFLNHWKPNLVFWLESELWPNHLLNLKKQNIPVILVNARLSDTAYNKWSSYKFIISPLLNCFSLCLSSSQSVAKKLKMLGKQEVKTPGNLKYTAGPLPVDTESLAHMKRVLKGRPIWVASSTHPGEEKIFIETHKFLKKYIPNLLTIVIPRHPERRKEISEEIKNNNLNFALRSLDHDPCNQTDIYIADTLGELGLFFRLTNIVVLGGSFVPVGGHNPLEPAFFHNTIIWGPHMFNFLEIEKTFLKNKAAYKIPNTKKLNATLLELLSNAEKRTTMGKKSKQVLKEKIGVLSKTLKYLCPFIEKTLYSHKK